MHNMVIRDCWDIIRRTDAQLLADRRLPLIDIESYLSYFNLPLLPTTATRSAEVADVPCSMEPSFKDLTDDLLISLRRHIYARTESATVAKWAEKLMRFCEIRYHTLKARAIKKFHGKDAAQLHVLHLASFFMDQAIYTEDLRLLNTVLKLADLKWLLNRPMIGSRLRKQTDGFLSALFQFRIVLATEYAIDQLHKDKVI